MGTKRKRSQLHLSYVPRLVKLRLLFARGGTMSNAIESLQRIINAVSRGDR